ncbi:hypothetical protein ElyMa_000209700 [Elysia marginata]|uniref:BESS domain-containing protein n=1 Tax=Elysia marginata TaxID=1093978 RepID=A0AAV4EZM6_9GAST|nr:hypothetical protein ElyMa_000209700 [Elysia marginata]
MNFRGKRSNRRFRQDGGRDRQARLSALEDLIFLKLKSNNNRPVTVEDDELEDVDSFTYLGSTINEEGGEEEDLKKRIEKARQVFSRLKKIMVQQDH